MLGSLLDQDEIEEFMAEADAVTHNQFLSDPGIHRVRSIEVDAVRVGVTGFRILEFSH